MKKKKNAVTLIEMMVVILLIGLIAGVLAYNFRGSLDQGKVFKTKEGIQRLENLLTWEIANGKSLDDIRENWESIVPLSPLGGQAKDLLQDGWNQPYTVDVLDDGQVIVHSSALDAWYVAHPQ